MYFKIFKGAACSQGRKQTAEHSSIKIRRSQSKIGWIYWSMVNLLSQKSINQIIESDYRIQSSNRYFQEKQLDDNLASIGVRPKSENSQNPVLSSRAHDRWFIDWLIDWLYQILRSIKWINCRLLLTGDAARQKIQRLNQSIKDKERLIKLNINQSKSEYKKIDKSNYRKLQADSKSTNMRELRIQQDVYLREIMRLKNVLSSIFWMIKCSNLKLFAGIKIPKYNY